MLQSIYIQDYALIDKLEIDFSTGFSVITGETGAGKSIILGAIGLLLGQRADVKAIKANANKCIIEARFNVQNYELEEIFQEHDIEYDKEVCILRREVSANGKSRAFINDTPASLTQMKEIGDKLIDIHSQHQNLLLNKEDFQINILDILAGNETDVAQYKATYKEYKQVLTEFEELKSYSATNRNEEEYLRFQLNQLEEAELEADEQEELEQELELLTHAEDIKEGLYEVQQSLDGDEDGILSQLHTALHTLEKVANVYSTAEEWVERLRSCHIELKDLAQEIEDAQEEVESNPKRLEAVNNRLNTLYSLQQKHHVGSVAELIALEERLRASLEAMDSFDERLEELQKKSDQCLKSVLSSALRLTEQRTASAQKITDKMTELLVSLGMPNARFVVELTTKKSPDMRGMDTVAFLFSANKNGTLHNVASIASGGEIARVMLSLKALIANTVKLPTIIFDEIDTGVSGSIAEKMALIMEDMGKSERQVISITHLPQIAAKGAHHYKVYKEETEEGTTSHIIRLTPEERIKEIAYMLSGTTLTDAAIDNAKVLLGLSKQN